jgi:hypothetical protein
MKIISDPYFNNGAILADTIRSIYITKNGDRQAVRVAYDGGSWSDSYDSAEQAIETKDRLIKKWKGGVNMFEEIKETASKFLQENRMLIAWIAVLFLADHFFFGGQFRQRLQAVVEKVITGVEKKVEAIK